MLDFGFVAADRALVLDVGRVVLLRLKDHWSAESSLPLPLSAPLPRDPRGRIQIGATNWTAWLPDAVCAGTVDPLDAGCRVSAEAWPTAAGPARMAQGRNYFEGPAPFYSAAVFADTVLFAGLDRRTRVQNEAIPAWGSDLATISSDCGAGQQVLATRATDSTESDAIIAYELPERRSVAVSNPIELPGQVTALWSVGTRAAAVVYNSKVSQYEAYSLAIRCPH
jgi:hypothetical protein